MFELLSLGRKLIKVFFNILFRAKVGKIASWSNHLTYFNVLFVATQLTVPIFTVKMRVTSFDFE